MPNYYICAYCTDQVDDAIHRIKFYKQITIFTWITFNSNFRQNGLISQSRFGRPSVQHAFNSFYYVFPSKLNQQKIEQVVFIFPNVYLFLHLALAGLIEVSPTYSELWCPALFIFKLQPYDTRNLSNKSHE